MRSLLESADLDNNSYIDKKEFLALIQKHGKDLEKIQNNTFLKYMRIAAYADEYRFAINWNSKKNYFLFIFKMVAPSFIHSTFDYHKYFHLLLPRTFLSE